MDTHDRKFSVVFRPSKTLLTITTVSVLVLIGLCFRLQADDYRKSTARGSLVSGSLPPRRKLILAWTGFFSREILFFESQTCQYQCDYTHDREEVTLADAVVFHPHNFVYADRPSDRDPKQRYIYYCFEAPTSTNGRPREQEVSEPFWNWTFTYRTWSDIFSEFYGTGFWADGTNRYLTTKRQIDFQLGNKSRAVAWFVSSCDTWSKREVYVEELRKYIEVNIFGKCLGGAVCPKKSQCEDSIAASHFFYIAFENSICEDYITEKLWRAVDKWMVPIVLSREIVTGFLPDDSFIATNDFDSPKDLAAHLNKVTCNWTLYRSYFNWRLRPTFEELREEVKQETGWCQLCRKLYEDSTPKTYPYNLKHWLADQCSGDWRKILKNKRL